MWGKPLTRAPLKPRSLTARVSSRVAASGSCIGSAANPANRSGCRATAAASASFARRATSHADAASGMAWMAGAFSERIASSMPCASISARRPASRSSSRARSTSHPTSVIAYCSESPSVSGSAKCSSSAMKETWSDFSVFDSRKIRPGLLVVSQLAIGPIERPPGRLPQPEVRLQHLERSLHADGDVLADRLGAAQLVAAADRVDQVLMPGLRVFRLRLPHDAEPDRRQRVRLLDGVEQRRAARALRDARVQLLMNRDVQLPILLRRQRVDAHRQPLQLSPLDAGGDLAEAHRRLHLQRFPDDVVALDVFGGGNPDARAGTRPAF